ncbi:glycoside hydrolase family 20 zincin-like fold domain-containing protein [Paenibacillus ginsengarvi]|nr:glycoside hydrolase family 20 zincin-like fold domain-containing protein [Paenibacillus ginsengarvi]
MLELYQDHKGKTALAFPHFPTRLQAVVGRNWGLVPAERIAAVLQTSAATVRELAQEMGFPTETDADPLWMTRGYITIIRANWHLLPYGQLLELLGWTEEQLAFALKEDDFLWIKLGALKPQTEEVHYRPLTASEKELTRRLREQLNAHFPEGDQTGGPYEEPFAFLGKFGQGESGSLPQAANVRQAQTDEVTLGPRYRVARPEEYRHAKSFVERFAKRLERKWGISPATQEDAAASGDDTEISLHIVPDSSLLGESHRIEVTPHRIRIESVDEPGLLRGLQWLERQMDERGGPFVRLGRTERLTKIDLRYIYSFFAVYGDPLIDPELDPYPDDLLERLSDIGVNGIWLQSVLYNLIPWEEAPELSDGWEKRLEGLRKLTERAADYGIGVYLYYNEPRAMPLPFYDTRPDWKGHTHMGLMASRCTSRPEVQQYLWESTARLFREVPGLAGLFTITMSENLTNCYSHAPGGKTECPRCSQRPRAEVIAEVNRCIAEGAFSAKPDARIVCWTWGWTWSEEEVAHAISLLPDGVRLMSNSEDRMPTNVAGVPGSVSDYSISIVGPGERARHNWSAAAARGLATAAKVQLNNTWECSAVPFLPVFDLVEEHLSNLEQSGISGLMLSWTLGGYPSLSLELASEYYWDTTSETADGQQTALERGKAPRLRAKFGEHAGGAIAEATSLFSQAFREFPFQIGVAYTAPQNFGPSNLLYLEPTGYQATMIGFPYDDLKRWRSIYPENKFAAQFRKLSLGWKKGIVKLGKARRHVPAGAERAFEDLMNAAEGAYYHFRSTYLQIAFVRCRDRMLKAKSAAVRDKERRSLLAIVEEELAIAKSLFALIRRDSRIGFEASNHYFYTAQQLQEKVWNCLYVRDQLQAETAEPMAAR